MVQCDGGEVFLSIDNGEYDMVARSKRMESGVWYGNISFFI
jgi:hypothetical protein